MPNVPISVALIETLPPLIWAALVLALIWWGKDHLETIVKAVIGRVERGEPVKVWVLELPLAATKGEVLVPESGRVKSIHTPERQDDVDAIYAITRNIMLVHQSQRRPGGDDWEVALYVVEHWGDLRQVKSVEHFLDSGWSGQSFVSDEVARSFAVKVRPRGPVLCTARINFTDGGWANASRYINLD